MARKKKTKQERAERGRLFDKYIKKSRGPFRNATFTKTSTEEAFAWLLDHWGVTEAYHWPEDGRGDAPPDAELLMCRLPSDPTGWRFVRRDGRKVWVAPSTIHAASGQVAYLAYREQALARQIEDLRGRAAALDAERGAVRDQLRAAGAI